MKVLVIKISKFSLNNGKDAQNVKYSYKKLKDAITWSADAKINFVSCVLLTGSRVIINASKVYRIDYSLAKLNKCQKVNHF